MEHLWSRRPAKKRWADTKSLLIPLQTTEAEQWGAVCASSPAAHSAKKKHYASNWKPNMLCRPRLCWPTTFGIYRIRMCGWQKKYIGENAQCPRHPRFPDWSVHIACERTFRQRRGNRRRQNLKRECSESLQAFVFTVSTTSALEGLSEVVWESNVPPSGLSSTLGRGWYCFFI